MKRCSVFFVSFLILITGLLASMIVAYAGHTAMAQTAYYVDRINGSDANSGISESLAWKTISKVNLSVFQPGDRVLFRRGQTWRENLRVPSSGSPGNHILFGTYGTGPKPIINGSTVATGWTLASGNIYKCAFAAAPRVVVQDANLLTYRPWVTDVATTFSGAKAGCFSTNGVTAYVWATDGADPDAHTMEVGCSNDVSSGDGIQILNKAYVIIDGLTVCNSGNGGVSVYVGNTAGSLSNIIIRNCTIFNTGGSGIAITGPMNSNTLTTCLVTQDTVYNARCHGIIFAHHVKGSTVSHNLSHNNGWGPEGWHNISSWGLDTLTSPDGNVFEYNRAFGGRDNASGWEGTGIQMDGCTLNSIVRYNVCHNNEGSGIAFFASRGNVACYNILYCNDVGFSVGCQYQGQASGSAYNNVIYRNYHYGIHIGGLPRRWLSIKNNILIENAVVGKGSGAEVRIDRAASSEIMDYNCVYHTGWKNFMMTDGNLEYTFQQWKDAMGFDANSIDADPLVADTAARDFHLQIGSPAINAGTNLGYTQDFDGNPIVGTPNMGAFEEAQTLGDKTGQLPLAPVILLQSDGARIEPDSARFIWKDQQSVDRFWFEYSSDSLFSKSTVDSMLTDTTVVLGSLTGHYAIWWRLRAHNSAGWGLFSATRRAFISASGSGDAPLGLDFRLDQNYPNPFNPRTTIRYTLPRDVAVTIEIFDLLGRTATTLISGMQRAGSHTEEWDASGFSSGVYLCRMRAGDFSEVRRLILLK